MLLEPECFNTVHCNLKSARNFFPIGIECGIATCNVNGKSEIGGDF